MIDLVATAAGTCHAGLLEVIVLGPQDAVQAAACGADRLEVVAAIEQGGLTPSTATLRAITRACKLPAMVMLRPHAHSFVYDDADMRAVREAVAMAYDNGARGLVFGALTEGGAIDTARLEQVLRWADGLPVTFHRAFDAATDLHAAFGVLGRYRGRVAQVLTSGGRPTATEGSALLRQLVDRWRDGDGVEPLVGSGVGVDTLAVLKASTGARHFHVGSGARLGSRYDAPIDPARMAALRRTLQGQ